MKYSVKKLKRDTEAHNVNKAKNEKETQNIKNAKNAKRAKTENTFKERAGCAKGENRSMKSVGGVIGYRELRNNISEVIENVISDYKVVISGNVKKNNKKTAAIISTQILGDILSVYKFNPEINFDNSTNQFEVILREINLYGYGDTKDEAIEMTTDMAIDLTEDYFDNADMYARIPSERSKYPYFLRIRNCSERDEVKKVLGLAG